MIERRPEAVVIGASAGALEALSGILPLLPREFRLPTIVVVHLPSDKRSVLAELFQAKCQLPVREAEDKEPIEGGTIYFAPPDYHLLIEVDKGLALSSDEPVLFSRPSIDVLFESAADAYGPALVAIVLTGANHDGAKGLLAVVDAGGTALVQDPKDAFAAAMPEAAIDMCPSARVMSLNAIAAYLRELRDCQMSPVTFLLVDDLEENLLSLEALLRRDNLVLLKARSGDQALELLLRHDVALALIDVQMPGLNGFELAELMRGNERTRRVPIIFVTAGSADSQRRFRGYETGAVDFIQKPIEPDILRSKADVFFELYQQREQIAAQRDELGATAAALKHANEQQAMLLREINHRIKNLFSVTSGLVLLTARSSSSVDELVADLTSRLQALARAHDLTLPDLDEAGSIGAETTVAALIRAILAPHEHEYASRIVLTGSDVPLSGSGLTSLALVLHELATNAAKYGALSTPHGRLTIAIAAKEDFLDVAWIEKGSVPSADAQERKGFGTVLERAALRTLGGTISRHWHSDGLTLSLKMSLANLTK